MTTIRAEGGDGMLPQAKSVVPIAITCVALALLLAVAGCGKPVTPESRVRAVVAEGERTAEARDLGGLMALVAPDFQDARGGDREELRRYLRGYFVMHQSVHLLTRIDSVEFPYEDYARVRLTVGALGRGSEAATAFDVAADVHEVALELRLEGDDWRVVRAGWRSARRD
jgi:hypothetical protein